MIANKQTKRRKILPLYDLGTRQVVESAIESSKASHATSWDAPPTQRIRPWEFVSDVNSDKEETAGVGDDPTAVSSD